MSYIYLIVTFNVVKREKFVPATSLCSLFFLPLSGGGIRFSRKKTGIQKDLLTLDRNNNILEEVL